MLSVFAQQASAGVFYRIQLSHIKSQTQKVVFVNTMFGSSIMSIHAVMLFLVKAI